jgi:membrane glycosyltransferase
MRNNLEEAPSPDQSDNRQYQDPIANLYEWQRDGRARRVILLMLTLIPTLLAGMLMSDSMPEYANTATRFLTVGLFLILFSWVSAGFWTAMAGFLVLLGGGDKHGITRTMNLQQDATPVRAKSHARTAIVMPICNEDVARVFAGLRATYESLAGVEQAHQFDFFVLSDSYDSDICTAELDAWSSLCRAVGGFDRIFYRRRHRRVKRKSGNISDFCRRWGKNYQYMVVLDADSVMSGTCLSTLVDLMEANPRAGIIQTAPRVAGRGTLYARMQQFATRVYGPLYTAGLHFWQLGESHYWGHNAIIRIAPFMRHCGLAPLPGSGPLSGDILSHDFIEAALMRRAGWTVWVAYDLPGSYEEIPPNLLDELGRDRRWCLGNMMNFRLILERGIHPVYRAVFASGVMAYFSSLLWLTFLLLSTAVMASAGFASSSYVSAATAVVTAPVAHVSAALLLFIVTASLLIVPKVLAIARICMSDAMEFGGPFRLIFGMVLEVIFSALAAPIRMLFHCQFVLSGLLGSQLQWKSPSREDTETTWAEGARKHGVHTVLGIVWALGVYLAYPAYLVWLLPVVGALILSIPLSVFSSRKSLGMRLRDMKLLLTPEEFQPPAELSATVAYQEQARSLPGFADAVVDPSINALMIACGRKRPALQSNQTGTIPTRAKLLDSAILHGPDHLKAPEKRLLLSDPIALFELHVKIWKSPWVHPSWSEMISRCEWLPAIIGCHESEAESAKMA